MNEPIRAKEREQLIKWIDLMCTDSPHLSDAARKSMAEIRGLIHEMGDAHWFIQWAPTIAEAPERVTNLLLSAFGSGYRAADFAVHALAHPKAFSQLVNGIAAGEDARTLAAKFVEALPGTATAGAATTPLEDLGRETAKQIGEAAHGLSTALAEILAETTADSSDVMHFKRIEYHLENWQNHGVAGDETLLWENLNTFVKMAQGIPPDLHGVTLGPSAEPGDSPGTAQTPAHRPLTEVENRRDETGFAAHTSGFMEPDPPVAPLTVDSVETPQQPEVVASFAEPDLSPAAPDIAASFMEPDPPVAPLTVDSVETPQQPEVVASFAEPDLSPAAPDIAASFMEPDPPVAPLTVDSVETPQQPEVVASFAEPDLSPAAPDIAASFMEPDPAPAAAFEPIEQTQPTSSVAVAEPVAAPDPSWPAPSLTPFDAGL
ncbi:hypothetical protein ACFQ9X_17360 [Catenulispora yoronensis]